MKMNSHSCLLFLWARRYDFEIWVCGAVVWLCNAQRETWICALSWCSDQCCLSNTCANKHIFPTVSKIINIFISELELILFECYWTRISHVLYLTHNEMRKTIFWRKVPCWSWFSKWCWTKKLAFLQCGSFKTKNVCVTTTCKKRTNWHVNNSWISM